MRLIVQHIEIDWDKRARGGTRAAKRARVPMRLVVPALGPEPGEEGPFLLSHRVVFSGFRHNPEPFARPTVTTKIASLSTEGATLAPFRYEPRGDRITVTLAQPLWTAPTRAGLPSRPTRVSAQIAVLEPGTWLSIVDNERVQSFDDFWYRQHHTNVAWIPAFRDDIFTKTEPSLARDWRSDLW